MLKKQKLLLIFSFLFLFVLTLTVTAKTYAAVGCCTANLEKGCAVAPAGGCPSGQRLCDTNDNTGTCPGNTDCINPNCFIQITPPEAVKITDFGKLFSGAVGLLLLIAFIMSFLYLILGGLSWVTSGGDKAAVETARNKILAALIGLIIVAATWALFQLIGGAIGFNILRGFDIPRLF